MERRNQIIFFSFIFLTYVSTLWTLEVPLSSRFRSSQGPTYIREVLPQYVHSDDVSFIQYSTPVNLTEGVVLSVFVRVGTKFLRRFIESIDAPVKVLLLVQDGEDDEKIAPLVKELVSTRTGPNHFIRKLRHVLNLEHSGCAQAFNTVFRLYPTEPYWLLASNDVMFLPGELSRFQNRVSERVAADADLGMYSTGVDFGGGSIRRTFGVMAFAMTRNGVVRGGLFDENFYPSTYEDDDIVLRFWLAGLKFECAPDIVIRHGDGAVYETGTATEDTKGEYLAENSRSQSRNYLFNKWGPGVPRTNPTDYTWLSDPNNREKIFFACSQPAPHSRFCSPFDSGYPVSTWRFSEEYRACVRGNKKESNCNKYVPTSLF
jgi:hypothetical protein